MEKSLKNKAVSIKGKDYVQVHDRVLYFNEVYINGSIQTSLLSEPQEQRVVVKCVVTPDHDKPERYFVGMAQEVVGDGFINKTSALENAETSAVGRALAMMGIGVIESIASVDEINKAKQQAKKPQPKQKTEEEQTIEIYNAIEKIENTKTMEELKAAYVSLPASIQVNVDVVKAKDKLKAKYASS